MITIHIIFVAIFSSVWKWPFCLLALIDTNISLGELNVMLLPIPNIFLFLRWIVNNARWNYYYKRILNTLTLATSNVGNSTPRAHLYQPLYKRNLYAVQNATTKWYNQNLPGARQPEIIWVKSVRHLEKICQMNPNRFLWRTR